MVYVYRDRGEHMWTYPFSSNSDLLRLFLHKVVSTRALCSVFSSSIKAPNGSIPFSLRSSIGVTAQIDIERRRSPREWAVGGGPPPLKLFARLVRCSCARFSLEAAAPSLCERLGTGAAASSANAAAKHGSLPATEPDVVLSRRNRPITELIGRGFDRPPLHFSLYLICVFFYRVDTIFRFSCVFLNVFMCIFFDLCDTWNTMIAPIEIFLIQKNYFFAFDFFDFLVFWEYEIKKKKTDVAI